MFIISFIFWKGIWANLRDICGKVQTRVTETKPPIEEGVNEVKCLACNGVFFAITNHKI